MKKFKLFLAKSTTVTVLLFISLFSCFNANAQKLLINDLVKIYYLNDDELDTYLSLKGFEFSKREQKEDANVDHYVCRLSTYEREYLIRRVRLDSEQLLTYNVFDQKSYIAFKQSALKFGFVYLSSENYKGKLLLKYKKGKLFLFIFSGVEDGQTYTTHEFSIDTNDN